ncbi:MAG TPA: hypothetical protein VEH49_06210, partial [Methylomirabilota bacterium]|nr:hypothetical protein [Methylomirabilota bacterium]
MNHIGVRRFAAGAGLLAIAIASASSSALSDPQQPLPAPLHGVVSRVSLSPLLLSAARRVRFSPDGAFILVQDDAGILVFT